MKLIRKAINLLVNALTTTLIFTPLLINAQTDGDYRSAATGVGWAVNTSWEKYNGGWATPSVGDYPGSAPGAGTVTIRDGHSITLNVSITLANAIGALIVGEGSSGSLTTDITTRTLFITNDLTIGAGGSYNLFRTTLTVSGNTFINGSMSDGNNSGSAIFTGSFTVNNGGSFSTANSSAFTFRNGITNDGTFNKTGSGAVAFNSADQVIGGSQPIVMNGTVTITTYIVTNNNADVSLTSTGNPSLTGSGTWLQGSGSVLKFSGTSMNCTVDFNTNSNTVNYTRGGTQTVLSTTYQNLTISTSGTKTLGGAITVNGVLSVTTTSATALACDIYQITGNGSNTFTMASATTLTLGRTTDPTDVPFPTNFGNISLNGTSTVTYQNNATQTVSGTPTYRNLTIATGGTKTVSGNLDVGGNLLISVGTFTLGGSTTSASVTGNATITGTFDLGTNATSVTISGNSPVAGSLIFNGTSTKNVTITGNLSGAGTIDMSGGNLLHSLTLNGTSNAIGTFTTAPVASTVTYGNTTATTTVFGSTNYRNLVITGGGSFRKDMSANVTVNNDLTIQASSVFNPAGFNLDVTGTTTIIGTLGDRAAAGINTLGDVEMQGGIINDNAANQSCVTTITGDLLCSSGANATGRVVLTVNGTTTVANNATLTLTNTTAGVFRRFDSQVILQGNATWNSNAITTASLLEFRGGIDVAAAASFSAWIANFTVSQNLSGTGTYTFGGAVTITGAITITNQCTNTSGITFNSTLNGTDVASTWENDVNSVAQYSGSATQPMNTGILDVSALGNKFYYGDNAVQTIRTPLTTYYHLYITGGAGTKSLSASTEVDGNFEIAASTSFNPGDYDFTVDGNSNIFGTFADATVAGTTNLDDVNLSGGTINGTLNGVVLINGDLTMPSGDATIGRVDLTVSGTATIPSGYDILFNNANGTKIFEGAVTINGTGTWTSTTIATPPRLEFKSGITNNNAAAGSFAAGTATFSTISQNLSGAGAFSFSGDVIVSGAITVTNQSSNSSGITFTDILDGNDAASTWVNDPNTTVYYEPGAATQPMNTIGILDVDATGNYFHYSRGGTGTQSIKATTYHHLYSSGTAVKTIQGATIVNGNLNIGASTTVTPAGNDLTVLGTTVIDGSFTDGTNAGTNTFGGLVTINSPSGSLSTANNSPFVFEGGIINNGTFNKTGTGAVSFNTNNQDIDGTAAITMWGAVTIEADKTVTNKNTTGITLTGVLNGGNVSSKWVNDVNSLTYYSNTTAAPMNIGILDLSASGNTFVYNGNGAQPIKAPADGFHHLALTTAGIKLLPANIVVNGNLTIGAGATLDADITNNYDIEVKGNWVVNPGGTFEARAGMVTFNGTSDQQITSEAEPFWDLTIDNEATQVTLMDDVTVDHICTLSDGVVTTGSNILILTSTDASHLADFSNTEFVNGFLRRYIATNTSTYAFPLGNGTSSANYYRTDVVNGSLELTSFITGNFAALQNHDDEDMNVSDGWISYNSVNTAGVWRLIPNMEPTGGSYDIRLYIENFSGLEDNSFAPLKRPIGAPDATSWTHGDGLLASMNGEGRLVSDGYMLRMGLTTFSEHGGGEGQAGGGGLPIELLSFTATPKDNAVELQWLTATEINNDFFNIERSADGVTFETIGMVEGAGNSSQTKGYIFQDNQPLQGISYYRLKQTDYDGTFTYTNIVSVSRFNEVAIEAHIYPNPVTSSTIFARFKGMQGENDVQIKVADLLGKTIYDKSFQIPISNTLKIELQEHLSPGLYLMKILSGTRSFGKHILISE